MSAAPLTQAIALIRAGKAAEAQQLLEPYLEAHPHQIEAWLWYVETWPVPQQKIKVLELCLRHNPDQPLVQKALAALQARVAPIGTPAPQPPSPPASEQPVQMVDVPAIPRPAKRATGVGLWPIIILLALAAVCLTAYWLLQQPKANQNTLAIGGLAKLDALDIPIQPPLELDSKSKAEVLAIRAEAIQRYPDLLARDYEPSEAVFGQIVDGLPWWGIRGMFYNFSGERSIEGPAEESRFLVNPYLLVAAEFDALSFQWDRPRVTEAALSHPAFPYYCEAEQLHWQPRQARAEVTYNLSPCIARTAKWTTRPLTLADAAFSLIAYNARDLNLNYLLVSYRDSVNIYKPEAPASAYAIPHFIHQGGSCGYPGGCNNMSPDTPEISWIEIAALPAEATIWLWRQSPGSLEQSPDLIFVIHFK